MEIIAKKSLGQNFLKSKTALIKMLEAGEVNSEDIILEVGPGKGVLTEKLLALAKKVIAVEKDDRLIPFLQEKFAKEIAESKLEIIHGDILDFSSTVYRLQFTNYKVIANIPYYITGQFLRKFLEGNDQPACVGRPERIVVMVQKEIAQRIVANDQKESLLSISVKAFGQPKMIMKVGKENFSPAPKVDSAILLISNISKQLFVDNKIEEKRFFEVLHAGFAHKRKVLASNLKGIIPAEKLATLPKNIRAEDLTVKEWVNLIKK
jgi:16S rRNA (adenine1518-N6/adenine1519-N6)-dimethyltransferase